MTELQVAQQIYEYMQKVFFGKAPIDVVFRKEYGLEGAAREVLEYIWFNYIEPKE